MNTKPEINGIQQMGVGVPNLDEAWKWYNTKFGTDIKIFEEAAMAEYMLPYTGGKPRERRAILALSMQGGGGFEIWQHTGRTPLMPQFDVQLGDLGVCVTKLKTADINAAYKQFSENGVEVLSKIAKTPEGVNHFFIRDIYRNLWEIVENDFVFKKTNHSNGGVFGGIIGVKNIDDSLRVYRDILGYDVVLSDKEDVFADWSGVPGCENRYRRVLLATTRKSHGAFSPIFGTSQLELIQLLDREPKKIYEGRLWGDPGFIQICYDITGMDAMREFVKSKGFAFTVDSAASTSNFDMGEASGDFAYIEAPEGTLIEFVETHKVPIIKKLGLSINLKGRKVNKPLPMWLLKMFSVLRVKF